MKFSLIVATYGRRLEIKNLFESFKNQTFKRFEVIIIDQNEDNYVKELCEKYNKYFSIIYIHSNEKGLSKARNQGLKYVRGNIIAFPDDDCEYPNDLLQNVFNKFVKNKSLNILTCMSIDKEKNITSNGKWSKESIFINYNNIFKTAISYSIFIKYKALNDVFFDEKLGVGSIFGSGEETDMLLNLLHKNYIGYYCSNLVVYHPYKEINIDRAYNYALGYGAVIKKELVSRRNGTFLINFVRDIVVKPIIGMVIYTLRFNKKRILVYKKNLIGRSEGFFKYRSNNV